MYFKTIATVALALAISACTSSNEDATGSGANAPAQVDTTRQVATAPSTASRYTPGSQEELNATIGDRVFFDTDRYDLSSEARSTLDAVAAWMKTNSSVNLTVEGHADERGTRAYNLALGARRANAMKDYVSALGVASSRLNTVSYGKERPAELGTGPAVWAKNRRAVAVVR
mgnify:CR=1 FL=1|jgi:peptidoglycan-associated lipoprotein